MIYPIAPTYPVGTAVVYEGSLTEFHGRLMYVESVAFGRYLLRFMVSYEGEKHLAHVRPQSVRRAYGVNPAEVTA